MGKLTIGQKKVLAEFFANTAVVWLSAGVVTPLLVNHQPEDFIAFGAWGLLFAAIFLSISLGIAKGVAA